MEKVVCVTGASGFIASSLVQLLLQRGYSVKATVRNLSDPTKVAHLRAFEGAAERLQLYEADLLQEGSFDTVIDGCEGVFHTASPVFISVSDPQTELLDPAIKGTLNVLKSCKKASTVRRVVVTSSMAAVMINGNPLEHDVVVDETWFSDPVYCQENKEWYALSKTLAEKGMWKFAEENGLDLVALHPGFVIGPFLQPTPNLTSDALLNIIKEGNQLWASGVYRFVDLRDVSVAHVLAFENPGANGRYCLVGRVTRSSEALDILNRIFPSLNLHTPDGGEDESGKPPYHVSQEKARSLDLEFTPLEVTLRDTVECFMEKNLLASAPSS